jgi:uncharacterized surface protein with fasciclin (FAS1) repeats
MHTLHPFLAAAVVAVMIGCSAGSDDAGAGGESTEQSPGGGQSTVQDNESQPDILRVAAGSKDHTTLVAAVKAAGLENTLANAGPFTVFAPTDGAFGKLPAGTVEDLVKPENIDKLSTILYHHVLTSALDKTSFTNGQVVKMFDGTPVTMTIDADGWKVDGAKVVGSVRASNGWVHVVDAVVVPK